VQVAADRRWLERVAAHPVLIKAASHHLQEPDFSILRDTLLANAPLVVQDETGLEYGVLADTFSVRLYGKFTRPHRSFDQGFQRSLAAAYAKDVRAKPLPFRVGYEKEGGSVLQLAVREGSNPLLPGRCASMSPKKSPAAVKARRAG
jgi:hypothetical protein